MWAVPSHGNFHMSLLVRGFLSPDVLDARAGVHVELPTTFSQQKLNGGKISFVKAHLANEFGSTA